MRRAALCALLLCVTARADTALHSLWEIHGKRNTVYLLGSVHVLRQSDYPLAPALLNAYSNAKAVLMEVNLADSGTADMQAEVLASATLPEGKTLPPSSVRSATRALQRWRTTSGSSCRASTNSRPGLPPRPFRNCN